MPLKKPRNCAAFGENTSKMAGATPGTSNRLMQVHWKGEVEAGRVYESRMIFYSGAQMTL